MLDNVDELRTFQRILALGSLSAAARELNTGLAVVSKRLMTLEHRLGIQLISRTTRRLSATEAGAELLVHVERILEALEAAASHISNTRHGPHGHLRVSAPISFGRIHLAPIAAELAAQHAGLEIELRLSDRLVDLIEDRIDLAVRIGQPRDSTATFRKLADNRRGLFAAPAYLRKFGDPATVDELSNHLCLRYGDGNESWQLEGPNRQKIQFKPRTRLRSDNGDVVHDWTISGHGIVLRSIIDVASELATGRLQRLLPEWQTASLPIYALYPSSRYLTAKTRIFLETISRNLQQGSR